MVDVKKFYHDVIDDVINGIKDDFTEEGIDVEVLIELKKLWTSKLTECRVFGNSQTAQTSAQYAQRYQAANYQVRAGVPINRLPIQHNSTISSSLLRPIAPIIRSNPPLTAKLLPTQNAGNLVPGLGSSCITLLRPNTNNNQVNPRPIVLTSNLSQQQLMQARANNQISMAIRNNVAVSTRQPTLIAPQNANLNEMSARGFSGQVVQIGDQAYYLTQPVMQLQPQNNLSGQQNVQQQASTFNRTQVDGGVDGSDDDYEDTFSEAPSSVRQPMSVNSRRDGNSMTPRLETGPHHDLSSDEDDDDLVPATPGLTPPASALSTTGLTPRHRGIPSSLNEIPLTLSQQLRTNIETPSYGIQTPTSVAPRVELSSTKRSMPSPNIHKDKGVKRTALNSNRRNNTIDDFDDDDFDEDDEFSDESASLKPNASQKTNQHQETAEEVYYENEPLPPSDSVSKPRVVRRARKTNSNALSAPKLKEARNKNDNTIETEGDEDDLIELDELVEDGYDSTIQEEIEEEEEEPLNSGDDVSEEDPESMFESENVVVCQYDKIHRSRNKWKFHLMDGIMSIHGQDSIFQKAVGDADW